MKFKVINLRAYLKGNLGDDLFIKVLCNEYPKTKFILSGEHKYKKNFAQIKNLNYIVNDKFYYRLLIKILNIPNKFLHKYNPQKFTRKFLDSNEILFNFLSILSKINVWISGSCFMENNVDDEIYLQHLFEREKKYFNKSPFIIGCNFGPYKHEEFYDNYKELFTHASTVCFRDKYSLSLFKELPNVEQGSDIIFNYSIKDIVKPYEYNFVLISVTNLKKDFDSAALYYDQYIITMTRLVQKIIDNNMDVIFLGFCKDQGDSLIAHEIHKALNVKSNVKIIFKNYPELTMEEAVGYIAYAHSVIATRYHAMILALLFNKKVFSICYNEKMNHVIDDIGTYFFYVTLDNLFSLDIEETAYKLCNDSISPIELNKYIVTAKNHFKKLEKSIIDLV